MNFMTFDEGCINLDRVLAIRFRKNKNDGTFRNRTDYPRAVDVFTDGGDKPFTFFITDEKFRELKNAVAGKPEGGRA